MFGRIKKASELEELRREVALLRFRVEALEKERSGTQGSKEGEKKPFSVLQKEWFEGEGGDRA